MRLVKGVIHKPKKLNVTPDALSRMCGSILTEKYQLNLNGIHQCLGHQTFGCSAASLCRE